MKKMLATILLTALCFSANAKERTVDFSVYVINNYFTCDYVETVTAKYIEALGGEALDVECRGGLPYDQWNRVTAVIDSASADEDNTVLNTLTIKSNSRMNRRITDNCSLSVKVLDGILPAFEVEEVSKRDTCWGSEGRFNYDLTLRAFN